ncbi:MAG: hypothetical protein KIT76_08095 [Pseudolabrys sp.]|nr:hypothetical protein [Pseudolabrys sp.]MCW5697654.1 hypothetical protein [Bauldia sp.]
MDDPAHSALEALWVKADGAFATLRRLLADAFDAGRRVERETRAAELQGIQKKLTELLEDATAKSATVAVGLLPPAIVVEPPVAHGSPRAPKGSVRRTLLTLLTTMTAGPTVRQLYERNRADGIHDIAEASFRSTLGDLRKEGLVEKRGERWFLLQKGEGPGVEPGPSSDSDSAGLPPALPHPAPEGAD